MSRIDLGNSIMHLEMRVVKEKCDDNRPWRFEKPSPSVKNLFKKGMQVPVTVIADIEALARWLDYAFSRPGGFRFGIAGFIGLISGIGDVLDALLCRSPLMTGCF